MFDQLLAVLAVTGLERNTILEEWPGAKDYLDDDFEKMAIVGKLASLGVAMSVRRNFDNLLTMGFTRDEALRIVAGGSMNMKAGG